MTALLTTNGVYNLDKTKQNQNCFVLNINVKYLYIVHNGIEVKLHPKVKYLGYILDESLSSESMALNVIDKINSRLQFLYRQIFL